MDHQLQYCYFNCAQQPPLVSSCVIDYPILYMSCMQSNPWADKLHNQVFYGKTVYIGLYNTVKTTLVHGPVNQSYATKKR